MEETLSLPLEIHQGFNEEQLGILYSILEGFTCPKNQIIFRQGQDTDFTYILCHGRVAIQHKPYDGPPFNIAYIEEGGVFGWSAAFNREEYSSTSISLTRCRMFRVSRTNLKWLCDNYRETGIILLQQIAGILSKRMRCNQSDIILMLKNSIING